MRIKRSLFVGKRTKKMSAKEQSKDLSVNGTVVQRQQQATRQAAHQRRHFAASEATPAEALPAMRTLIDVSSDKAVDRTTLFAYDGVGVFLHAVRFSCRPREPIDVEIRGIPPGADPETVAVESPRRAVDYIKYGSGDGSYVCRLFEESDGDVGDSEAVAPRRSASPVFEEEEEEDGEPSDGEGAGSGRSEGSRRSSPMCDATISYAIAGVSWSASYKVLLRKRARAARDVARVVEYDAKLSKTIALVNKFVDKQLCADSVYFIYGRTPVLGRNSSSSSIDSNDEAVYASERSAPRHAMTMATPKGAASDDSLPAPRFSAAAAAAASGQESFVFGSMGRVDLKPRERVVAAARLEGSGIEPHAFLLASDAYAATVTLRGESDGIYSSSSPPLPEYTPGAFQSAQRVDCDWIVATKVAPELGRVLASSKFTILEASDASLRGPFSAMPPMFLGKVFPESSAAAGEPLTFCISRTSDVYLDVSITETIQEPQDPPRASSSSSSSSSSSQRDKTRGGELEDSARSSPYVRHTYVPTKKTVSAEVLVRNKKPVAIDAKIVVSVSGRYRSLSYRISGSQEKQFVEVPVQGGRPTITLCGVLPDAPGAPPVKVYVMLETTATITRVSR
jgi:hypothetical protein